MGSQNKELSNQYEVWYILTAYVIFHSASEGLIFYFYRFAYVQWTRLWYIMKGITIQTIIKCHNTWHEVSQDGNNLPKGL